LNADLKNRVSWSLSKIFFKQSVKRLESNDIKNANLSIQKAIQMMEASNEFSENTKKNFPSIKPFKNKNKRDRNFKEINNQMCSIRGRIFLAEGEKKFHEAVFIEENFNMDLIYDALDAANMAGKAAFGIDLELEAITEAFIGKIHN
jgi:hypothetical protein